MSDNDPILLGRAMPDDLSKKISEALNKKSITPEQELQDALDEMARDIAIIEPDPVTTRSTSVLLPLHLNPHLLAIGS
jgi:hypothetical protein